MEKNLSRPFYFHPPWNILFDLQVLERVNPWDVSLSFLLLSFLDEMEKRNEVDFRASGVALDSSAMIYLMKSRLLLKLEEPPSSPEPTLDIVPPPLVLPLRYELTTTTIQNLLQALDEALRTEKLFVLRAPIKEALPPPSAILPIISIYLVEIEEQMERLLQKIRFLEENSRIVAFSKIISGLEKLEQIQTFIVLLFLAHRGRISLWQEENSDEIIITAIGG